MISKAFPLVTLPFAFRLLWWPHFPMSRQILVSFCWMLLVPSFAAIFYFNQNFFLGLGAQVKLLPMLYFYTFLVLLLHFRPSLRELCAAFVAYGILTYVMAVLFWALVPNDWYEGIYVAGTSPIFGEDDRGHRIRMPMFFGLVAFFYFYRRFLREPRAHWLFGIISGFVVATALVKTRSTIVGMAGIAIINGFVAAGPLVRISMLFMAPVGLIGLFSIDYFSAVFNNPETNGLDIRIGTIQKATDFLGSNPLSWLFGVGTISPNSSDTLLSFFDHFFFLADITWLGVIFEYGIIGAIILLLFELRGLLFYHQKLGFLDNDFLHSLRDYVLYELLISQLYPLILSPGESAIIFSIFAYTWWSLVQRRAS
jgi:hypothetical protein